MELIGCRPVAYWPYLARHVGGVKAAVMLSQLLYWNGDQSVSKRDGWFWKTTEELEVEYASDPLDIGFNSRYLLDIAAQIEGEVAVLKLADPGSPTLVQDKDSKGALYVLMPMRV